MPDNILSIIIRAKDQGATATLNSIGTAIHQAGERARGLDEVQRRLGASSQQAIVGGLGLAGALAYLGKTSASGEQALREVNTILKLSGGDYERLRSKLNAVGDDYLVLASRVELANAAYDVASVKGFQDLDLITQIVQSSAVLATAGKETVEGAVSTVMDIMAAYRKRAPAEAKAVADEIYKAIEIGRMRVPELRGEIGPVVGVASQMGVDEKEILAGMAVLTNMGFTASEAATALERSLTSALTPSKAFVAAAKQMGYESTAALVQAKGLAGALQLVQQATQGDEMALAAIFPNVRALRGAMALSGEASKDFADAIEQIGNSAGASQAAALEYMKGPEAQWRRALIELQNEASELGRSVLPIMTEFAEQLRSLAARFRNMTPEQQRHIITMVKWTAETLLLVGALGKVANGVISIIRLGGELKAVVALLMAARTARAGGGVAGAAGAAAEVAQDVAAAARSGGPDLVKKIIQDQLASAKPAPVVRAVEAGKYLLPGVAPRAGGRLVQLAAQQEAGDAMVRSAAAARSAALTEQAGATLADRMIQQQLAAQMGRAASASTKLTGAITRNVAVAVQQEDRLAWWATQIGQETKAGVAGGAPFLKTAIGSAGALLANPIAIGLGAVFAAFLIDMKASGLGAALKDQKQRLQSEDAQQQMLTNEGYITQEQVAHDMGWTDDEWKYGSNIWFHGPLGGQYSTAWARHMTDEDRAKVYAEYRRRQAIKAGENAQARDQAAAEQSALDRLMNPTEQNPDLGPVYWPGGMGEAPKGYRTIPTGIPGQNAYARMDAADKGQMSYNSVTRRGAVVNNLTLNATFSDPDQMKRFLNMQLDKQFGILPA